MQANELWFTHLQRLPSQHNERSHEGLKSICGERMERFNLKSKKRHRLQSLKGSFELKFYDLKQIKTFLDLNLVKY